MPCLLGHFSVIAQREACPLAGECTWLLEVFVWGQVWNLFLTSFSFFFVGWVNHFMGHLQPRIENGYCACMLKICLYLLIEFWPGTNLIGNILLATAWNWLAILHAWHFSFCRLTLRELNTLCLSSTDFPWNFPMYFFSCKFSLKSRMPVKSAKRSRFGPNDQVSNDYGSSPEIIGL